eukprot:84211-Chlamydomonas_euryale.AAC.1
MHVHDLCLDILDPTPSTTASLCRIAPAHPPTHPQTQTPGPPHLSACCTAARASACGSGAGPAVPPARAASCCTADGPPRGLATAGCRCALCAFTPDKIAWPRLVLPEGGAGG